MRLTYFAHNGVDHGNGIEAASHQSNLPLILGVSAVFVIAVIILIKLISASNEKTDPKEDN